MKLILYRLIALLLLVILSPLLIILFIIIKLSSRGPFLFRQKRAGKNMIPFTMYKIRTMVIDAEKLKKKYIRLNETSFPVFKIHNDPRFTKIGKFLSHTGLDEIPQLINVVKGEMSLVGPRPLPIEEAHEIPDKYRRRFAVAPGITSPWVVKGSHKLTFKQWMEYDIEYIRTSSFIKDISILLLTVITICKLIFKKLLGYKL